MQGDPLNETGFLQTYLLIDKGEDEPEIGVVKLGWLNMWDADDAAFEQGKARELILGTRVTSDWERRILDPTIVYSRRYYLAKAARS